MWLRYLQRKGMTNTRVPSSLRMVALVAAGGVAFGVWGWYHPSDYTYAQRNDSAFAAIPVYPSGHFVRETTSARHAGSSALSRVVGYRTSREYRLGTAIPSEAIVDYYLYELRTCQVGSHDDDSAHFTCRKTVDVSVAIDGPTTAEHYQITVESR
jgi:hypothetical protein